MLREMKVDYGPFTVSYHFHMRFTMIARTLFSTTLALALVAPAAAFASNWNIDAGHSEVGFSVKHMMVSNTKGKFKKVEGTVELNDKDITKSKVSVSIDLASVDTDNEKRDVHLRGPDFFDVKKHPKMTFKSTKVTKSGDELKVVGQLTLHGVTKSVTLTVDGPSQSIKDPWGMTRRGLSATAKINRKDFGLTWSKTLETGGLVVGNTIKINLEIEMVQKK